MHLLVFGRFPAKLCPRTPPDGPGSKNGAERTEAKPRTPIRMSFRDLFCSTPKTGSCNPAMSATHLSGLHGGVVREEPEGSIPPDPPA